MPNHESSIQITPNSATWMHYFTISMAQSLTSKVSYSYLL